VTPGEFKRCGDGLTIQWGVHETPFGECLIGTTARGICGLYFITSEGIPGAYRLLASSWEGARLVENATATAGLVDQIFGEASRTTAPLALLVKGTNLQLKVWEALLRIPLGEVVSYEQLAAAAGAPTAVRAVGTAVGRNPVSYLIPCHRVIRKTGAFGNYGGGIARKRAMLTWEFARREGDGFGGDSSTSAGRPLAISR